MALKLTKPQRAVVSRMAAYRSPKEISEDLGITVNAIDSRIMRAQVKNKIKTRRQLLRRYTTRRGE